MLAFFGFYLKQILSMYTTSKSEISDSLSTSCQISSCIFLSVPGLIWLLFFFCFSFSFQFHSAVVFVLFVCFVFLPFSLASFSFSCSGNSEHKRSHTCTHVRTRAHTHTHTHLCFILSFLECCVCKDDFHECHKAFYSIFVLIPIVSSLYKRSACFHSWLSVQKVYSFPFFILCTKGLFISIYSSLYKRWTDFCSWFSVQKVNSFPFLVLCTEGLLIPIVCSLFKRSTRFHFLVLCSKGLLISIVLCSRGLLIATVLCSKGLLATALLGLPLHQFSLLMACTLTSARTGVPLHVWCRSQPVLTIVTVQSSV